MKTTHLKLKETKVNGERYWQVTIPLPGGGRLRRTYKNEKDAKARLSEAKIQMLQAGPAAATMDDLLRAQAIEAARLLEPYHPVTILDVVRGYIENRLASDKSCTVAEAVSELIATREREGKSRRYVRDLRSRLGQFAYRFGTAKMTEVEVGQIDDWLHGLKIGPVSRNTMRLRISTLFEYCIGRKFCTANPVEHVAVSKAVDKAPGILTPDQFARLLSESTEDTLPVNAIGGFAGLRSSELERLDWREVHFESGLIEVTADKAKTSKRRLVKIEPCLAQWLEPYRGRSGRVAPAGLEMRLRKDRKRAGINVWPSNALRHSFCSYHLAVFEDAGKLATQMGHRNSALIYNTYRELVRPEVAKRWWSITPLHAAGNVIEMSA
jgi:integrase